MGKYITLIYDEPYTSSVGENIYRMVNSTKTFTSTELATLFTPYTETDMGKVMEEAYEQGKIDAYVEDAKNITMLKEEAKEAYQRGYDDAKHECTDCQKIMTDAEQERVDKAYQQGVNDAENRKATCEFCGYVNKGQLDEPCKFCANNYINMFRPRKDNKLIRKNIKDIMDSLDCTISDFEKAIEEIKNEAD